jgi:hypothetical protein
VQLTHPVDPVRRAGRGSAPITRLVHLPPPSGPPAQVPSPLHGIDCSPPHICCPGSAVWRPSAPPPGPELPQG